MSVLVTSCSETLQGVGRVVLIFVLETQRLPGRVPPDPGRLKLRKSNQQREQDVLNHKPRVPKRPAHTDPTRISSSAGLRSFFGEGGSVALKRVGLQAERVQASADSDSQRERSMSRYIYIYIDV